MLGQELKLADTVVHKVMETEPLNRSEYAVDLEKRMSLAHQVLPEKQQGVRIHNGEELLKFK